jgi:hypothetical protein
MTAGCLPLVAKVADFGLALPLGPTDTHATLHARVRCELTAHELLSAAQHSISLPLDRTTNHNEVAAGFNLCRSRPSMYKVG